MDVLRSAGFGVLFAVSFVIGLTFQIGVALIGVFPSKPF